MPWSNGYKRARVRARVGVRVMLKFGARVRLGVRLAQ